MLGSEALVTLLSLLLIACSCLHARLWLWLICANAQGLERERGLLRDEERLACVLDAWLPRPLRMLAEKRALHVSSTCNGSCMQQPRLIGDYDSAIINRLTQERTICLLRSSRPDQVSSSKVLPP